MVREVVDDRDAALHAAHFHAPLDALKRLQSALDLLRRHAAHAGDGDIGEGVHDIVLAGKIRPEAKPFAPFPPCRERASFRCELNLGCVRIAAARHPEREPARPRVGAERHHIRIVSIGHDHILGRNLLHPVPERFDDRIEVRVDIGVIELDVVQQKRIGVVVQELRAFIEERRVVFVALDHELRPVPELEILIEIERDPANDHARIASRRFQQPGHQRRGRGLAVRSGHHDGMLLLDEELMNGLGHRGVRQVELQRAGRFSIRRGRHVADHHQIGMERDEVVLRIPLENRDAEAVEVGRHRRIDVLVGAGHFVAALLQHSGERGHGSAADADEVDLFQGW